MSVDLRRVRDATVVVLAFRLFYGVILAVAQMVYDAPLRPPRLLEPQEGLGGALYWHLINSWIFRDARFYSQIAAEGYDPAHGLTAFHPLFPLLSWVAALPFGVATVGVFIVSTLAAIGLTVAMARYVAEVHGPQWATPSAAALLCMPVGIVWLLLYTDGLFVAFAIGCLLHVHRRNWWMAAGFGVLATLTRQQGIVLCLPLLVAIWRADRRFASLASVALLPAAYLGFAAYRVFVLRDVDLAELSSLSEVAHAFLVSDAATQVAPGQRIAWPWEPLIGHVTMLLRTGGGHLMLDMVLGLGIVGFVASNHRALTEPEKLYCLGAAAVGLCYYNGSLAPYMALPRHMIIMFPVGYLLALRLWQRASPRALLGTGIAFNGLLALLYGTDRWIP